MSGDIVGIRDLKHILTVLIMVIIFPIGIAYLLFKFVCLLFKLARPLFRLISRMFMYAVRSFKTYYCQHKEDNGFEKL